jgi:hypothetical protein
MRSAGNVSALREKLELYKVGMNSIEAYGRGDFATDMMFNCW